MTPLHLSRRDIEELSTGPLGAHLAPYVAALKAQQYAPVTIINHQLVLVRFSRWLRQSRRKLRGLDEGTVQRFLRQAGGLSGNARAALERLLRQLRDAGVTVPTRRRRRRPAEQIAADYHLYLTAERGLQSKTASNYAAMIGRFLKRRYRGGAVVLRTLRAKDLVAEVMEVLRRHSRGYAHSVVTALRSFVGYLHYRGRLEVDLTGAVPAVAYWEQGGLPRYLPAGDVRRVLDRCERRTPLGRRNHAMLLLLAQLGLRASELLALRLDDIDWRQGRLRVRSVKGGPEVWVPLPVEAGQALACYLHEGRPAGSCRQVFVRGKAPYVGLACAGDVSNLVRQALDRAGVKSTCRGAHVLRHSLATEMMRQGASLEEIGEMLRHRSVNTTRRYAKVDVAALRGLAMPWPGGGR